MKRARLNTPLKRARWPIPVRLARLHLGFTQERVTVTNDEMRRRDRAKDDTWIRELLRSRPLGTLATVDDGQPFLNPNLFVYDEDRHAIYLHTAALGRTRRNIEGDARVSFAVSEMGRLLPADTALEFSVEYTSAIVFGSGTVVDDPAEARHGLDLLLRKYAPHLQSGRDYRPITEQELARTAVYRIDVDRWTGKAKSVERDFPGAFEYRAAAAAPEAGPDGAVFHIDGLAEDRAAAGTPFIEFLRTPGLRLEWLELPAGAEDRQRPHRDDEAYYVIRGRAQLMIAGESRPVSSGSVAYVRAGVEHRFHDITQDLAVLIFFVSAGEPA